MKRIIITPAGEEPVNVPIKFVSPKAPPTGARPPKKSASGARPRPSPREDSRNGANRAAP